jgi:hypothetical protein
MTRTTWHNLEFFKNKLNLINKTDKMHIPFITSVDSIQQLPGLG